MGDNSDDNNRDARRREGYDNNLFSFTVPQWAFALAAQMAAWKHGMESNPRIRSRESNPTTSAPANVYDTTKPEMNSRQQRRRQCKMLYKTCSSSKCCKIPLSLLQSEKMLSKTPASPTPKAATACLHMRQNNPLQPSSMQPHYSTHKRRLPMSATKELAWSHSRSPIFSILFTSSTHVLLQITKRQPETKME